MHCQSLTQAVMSIDRREYHHDCGRSKPVRVEVLRKRPQGTKFTSPALTSQHFTCDLAMTVWQHVYCSYSAVQELSCCKGRSLKLSTLRLPRYVPAGPAQIVLKLHMSDSCCLHSARHQSCSLSLHHSILYTLGSGCEQII